MSWYTICQTDSVSLWLDDIRPMPAGFSIHAKTAEEAIGILGQGNVRIVSLDHDLGKDENGTGYEVACWIEKAAFENAIPRIPDMRVHSSNPVGVSKMRQCIKNATRFWDKHETEE